MALKLAQWFEAANDAASVYIVEDKLVKGGFRALPSIVERDAMHKNHVKLGMVVVTQSDLKMWQLVQLDTTVTPYTKTWVEFKSGGPSRQTFEYTTKLLDPEEFETFTATGIGATVTLLKVSINKGTSQLEAHSTSSLNDTNPYVFLADPVHLIDDGTTTMSDGTVIKGRRYNIVANLEEPPKTDIYWKITNKGTEATDYTITIVYLKME